MLDLGANLECTPENLAEFALMGSVLAQSVEGIEDPHHRITEHRLGRSQRVVIRSKGLVN